MLFCFQQSFSQFTSWKGTVNSFWNNPANWTNGMPDNTKDAIIGDANFTGIFQPKVNVVSVCKSVTVGGAVAATLTFTRTLTMSGNLTINSNGVAVHPGITISVAGNFTNNGVYSTTSTSSRLIFNGTNPLVSGTAPIIFRRLTVNAGATLLLATNIKIDSAGAFFAVYGVVDPGQSPGYSVTSSGITRIYNLGKINVNAANFNSNYNFTGATTLYAGSIVDYSSTTTDQVVSSMYSYATLMISGTGIKSLASNLLPLYSKNINNGKILVNSGTLNLQTFTANRGTTKVGGEIKVLNGAFLKVSGPDNFPVNFATKFFDLFSTVEYNGADQFVSPQTYGNLLFSTAGIKTSIAAFNVIGNLTINNGTLNTNAVVVNHSVAGNFSMTGGAFTGTNYAYTLNGTADQVLNLTTGLLKLSINKTAGNVNLGADITVNSTLNFIKGNIITGNFNVIIPSTANVSGAAQSTGWVNGNLQKNIGTGSGVFKTFEIGGVNYSPVSILFANVATAGNLTASAVSVDQPELDYSGLDPSKSVNRFWALNNAGILFSNATVIFNWVTTDIDAGANTANFKTGLFNGTNWILPSFSSPMPNSIQANAVSSLGDFSVGETIVKSTWTGNAMTSDWFTPKNWLGLIPSITFPTFIPNALASGRVYPVLTSGTGTVSDITIENTASLTVSTAILQIAGALSSTGNLTATAGTIEFNGVSLQTILAGSFAGDTIRNLIVSNNLGLDAATIITGTLSLANGKTLATNDNLVLRSNASGTARLASLPVDGSGNATAFITGNVSIERYIPARKAWRLLSAPIKAGAGVTLQAAWQESAYAVPSFAPNPNPHPGYGVHISGGTLANGFDQSVTNSATVKVYSNVSNSFLALPPTPGTFASLDAYTGYLVYIRGDRSIDLSQGNNAAVTATTLRMKGEINTGNQTSNVGAVNFTVVGNPYPAAIDFATMTRNNVKNSFYVWDPKLAGSNGLGAYVTVSWNSGSGMYDVTTSASPVSQYIPSGEAILVESLDGINPGTLITRESDKTVNGSDFVFGRQVTSGQKLRTNLYAQNADGSSSLLDGALTTYDDNNSNKLDREDIKKFHSGTQDISLQREGRFFAIERRKTITENDTTFINIGEMKPGQYKLEIIAEQLDKPGFRAVLKDNFSSELDNSKLSVSGTTDILFTVTANPASQVADRFSIVFTKSSANTAVFSFKSIKGTAQQKNIALEWKTENESGISSYDIEGSADGVTFNRLSSVVSKAGGSSTYSWFDLDAMPGDHYYRIKTAGLSTGKKSSALAKVTIAGMGSLFEANEMTVYPNPIKNAIVFLQLAFLKRGMYVVEVTNANSQMIKRISLVHNGGSIKYSFPVDNSLPPGKYQIRLTDGAAVNFTTSMIRE